VPTKDQIEAKVLPLLQALWREQKKGALQAPDLISVLDPANAADLLGASIEYVHSIPNASRYGFRTAGMMDRRHRRIVVSTEFKPQEVRFTAAHELGHLVLHEQQALFRDRPLSVLATTASGLTITAANRPAIEVERVRWN
jgi:hypothetical protein